MTILATSFCENQHMTCNYKTTGSGKNYNCLTTPPVMPCTSENSSVRLSPVEHLLANSSSTPSIGYTFLPPSIGRERNSSRCHANKDTVTVILTLVICRLRFRSSYLLFGCIFVNLINIPKRRLLIASLIKGSNAEHKYFSRCSNSSLHKTEYSIL